MIMTTKLLPRQPPQIYQCLRANNANPCDSTPLPHNYPLDNYLDNYHSYPENCARDDHRHWDVPPSRHL